VWIRNNCDGQGKRHHLTQSQKNEKLRSCCSYEYDEWGWHDVNAAHADAVTYVDVPAASSCHDGLTLDGSHAHANARLTYDVNAAPAHDYGTAARHEPLASYARNA